MLGSPYLLGICTLMLLFTTLALALHGGLILSASHNPGGPDEEFASQFNWRAFRFVLVTGLKRKPSHSDAVAELITTDLPLMGQRGVMIE